MDTEEGPGGGDLPLDKQEDGEEPWKTWREGSPLPVADFEEMEFVEEGEVGGS